MEKEDVAYYSDVRFTWKDLPILDDECEKRDLVQEFEGKIIYTECYDKSYVEKKHVVGHVSGLRVDLGEALERHVATYDVLDTHSRGLEEYYGVFFSEGEFREDLKLDSYGDLLIISTAKVDPKYRGLGLGLLAVRRAMISFGGGCAMAAIKPFPLQFQGKVTPENEAEFDAAQKRLGNYWSRLGFVPYKDTEYYYFDLTHRKPSINEMLGRKKRGKANV